MKVSLLVSTAIVAALLQPSIVVVADERFEFESFRDIVPLFEQLDYTEATWRAGERAVPRVYLERIPERWRGRTADRIEVRVKKEVFFRLLAPLVLRSNELIAADRVRLIDAAGRSPRTDDEAWLMALAQRYRVSDGRSRLEAGDIEELVRRVDAIPPSLAMAQAANESGWGTSRFADLGNALFGQWTWGARGIAPEARRADKGRYRVASFETPQEAVVAYMQNLNSHPRYEALRATRADLASRGKPVTGLALAPTLIGYSERGQAYVDELISMIRYNRLDEVDATFLAKGPVILLVPVGAGAR
jgi:Bax protein